MLTSGHADPAWFSAAFLAQVPVASVDTLIAQLAAALGAYKGIDGENGDYTVRYEKGTDEVLIHLDADNKIDAFLFKPPKTTTSLDDALNKLRTSKGTVSYVISEGAAETAALNASDALAVGSAFKLAVLSALRDEISTGRRHWTDVVPLRSSWKTLPSGVIRTWPDGLPMTLATYAAQMISISDNTAADALASIVGPTALRKHAGRNAPFLTTREMFTLKSTEGASLRAAFLAAGTPNERSAVLRRVDALPLPSLTTLLSQPVLSIEWHFTVRELCSLMARVADLPLMTINPGVANPADFRRVAYKGGSDTGVINLTTHVTTKRGTTLCFSATLNNATAAVDESAFELVYAAALGALANR